jgi:hypothetical protein
MLLNNLDLKAEDPAEFDQFFEILLIPDDNLSTSHCGHIYSLTSVSRRWHAVPGRWGAVLRSLLKNR